MSSAVPSAASRASCIRSPAEMVGEATKGARRADLKGGDGGWTGILRAEEATLVTALSGLGGPRK
jgi:hypothetical protein